MFDDRVWLKKNSFIAGGVKLHKYRFSNSVCYIRESTIFNENFQNGRLCKRNIFIVMSYIF